MTEPEHTALGDAPMRAAVLYVLASGLALTVFTFFYFGARSALGVLIGGALATANLLVFARLGEAFLSKKGNSAPWAVVAILKLTFLFGGVALILRSDLVPALGLAGGYAALPIGITLGSLFGPKPKGDEGDGKP